VGIDFKAVYVEIHDYPIREEKDTIGEENLPLEVGYKDVEPTAFMSWMNFIITTANYEFFTWKAAYDMALKLNGLRNYQIMKYNKKEVQCDCGEINKISVHQTNVYPCYYVGLVCQNCGPIDRVSGYFQSKEEAQQFIDSKNTFQSYWEN
jgi:hypothetical protein